MDLAGELQLRFENPALQLKISAKAGLEVGNKDINLNEDISVSFQGNLKDFSDIPANFEEAWKVKYYQSKFI